MNTQSVMNMKTAIESLDDLNNLTDEKLEELILNAAKTENGASMLIAPGKVAFTFANFQMFDAEEFLSDSHKAAGRISIAISNLLVDGKIQNKELELGSGRITYVVTSNPNDSCY